MKITKRQLKRIIREERAQLDESRYEKLTLASIDQHINPLQDMIEQHGWKDNKTDLRIYDQAFEALMELRGILQKIAEGGSGAPTR